MKKLSGSIATYRYKTRIRDQVKLDKVADFITAGKLPDKLSMHMKEELVLLATSYRTYKRLFERSRKK
jgi:hypothetical protein